MALLVYATEAAVEQAAGLLVEGAVLETVVQRAIEEAFAEGRVIRPRRAVRSLHRPFAVDLGDGLVAVCERTPRRVDRNSPNWAWLVVRLQARGAVRADPGPRLVGIDH